VVLCFYDMWIRKVTHKEPPVLVSHVPASVQGM
jgi:hypothetical protein